MNASLLSVVIQYEQDAVVARQRARHLAQLLGFDVQDQTRIATAVSEIARNAFSYAGGGRVDFSIERTPPSPQSFCIRISDHGPGIKNLSAVLAEAYESPTGLGVGIVGSRRLMDEFSIDSVPGRGTVVVMTKQLPPRRGNLTAAAVGEISSALAAQRPKELIDEVRAQNQELLTALEELRRRQDELARVNAELEDTNRGVVALYAELDERANHLRRSDEVKSKFFSNMSHEFRSPLNSIVALSNLLLSRTDGPLTSDQEQQVSLIRHAATDLTDLVNDLLDLSKMEAGKSDVRAVEFEVENLFGALRGMFRPLLTNPSVNLVFEADPTVTTLCTDEGKLSQILRNLISNALKFTEAGEVSVRVARSAPGFVAFAVSDTGIGIGPGDMPRIFEDYIQVDSPLQRRVRGTGLGLPLSRKLAQLLGGGLTVESQPGRGSIFRAVVRERFQPEQDNVAAAAPTSILPTATDLLLVDRDPGILRRFERALERTPFHIYTARDDREALQWLQTIRPAAIVRRPESPRLAQPLLDASGRIVPEIVLAVPDPATALPQVRTALSSGMPIVLLIDDDPAARYLIRQALEGRQFHIVEADGGGSGIEVARAYLPAYIVLDLAMPDLGGMHVLQDLRNGEDTRHIPVLINSSQVVSADMAAELRALGANYHAKASWDPESLAARIEESLKPGQAASTR